MSVDNELLRNGIIDKLKEYEAYIDNELPDYIMVMLANNKTMLQVNSDLRLFLGDNTDRFTSWLSDCLKTPSLLEPATGVGGDGGEDIVELMAEEDMISEQVIEEEQSALGRKRKRSDQRGRDEGGHEGGSPIKISRTSADEHLSSRVRSRTQRVKPVNEDEGQRSRGRNMPAPDSSRDVDLRELLSKRRQHRKGAGPGDDVEEDSDGGEGGEGVQAVSSVVRVVERPKVSSKGGSRLLKMAIAGIGHTPLQRGGGGRRRSEGGREKGEAGEGVATKETPIKLKKSVTPHSSKKSVDSKTVRKLPATSTDQPSEEGGGKEEEEEQGSEEELSLAEHIERSTLAAVQKIIPSLAATRAQDLRQIINRNREDKHTESTRFVVTLSGAPSQSSGGEGGGGVGDDDILKLQDTDDGDNQDDVIEEPSRPVASGNGGSGSGLPDRCRFWPNCKNGDTCPFHHPTVPCKLFPSCKYGNKCLFVHPQCKYDSRCTRPDCSYLHTSPRRMLYQQQQQQQGVPAPVAMPTMFSPQGPAFSAPPSYSYAAGGSPQWPRPPRFPKKSALTWTPSKHISDRAFAVPDKQTSSLPVKQ